MISFSCRSISQWNFICNTGSNEWTQITNQANSTTKDKKICEINVMFSRFTSFIEVGGRVGLGYRDTAQDAMMVVHADPEGCKKRIVQLLKALTYEGYGLHLFEPRWFEPEEKQQSFKSPTVVPTPDKSQIVHGLKDACADDALWLVSSIVQYVRETGDVGFVDTVVRYADGGEETVYDHELLRYSQFHPH